MNVLFLITARGGSKGIPGKNLRQIGGTSLVGYKALSARKSKYCSRLIISTDSPEIQADARSYGVEVPFTRPAELATDTARSADVVWHAMQWIEQHTDERYDAIMLLEPASPFARASDYDGAIEMMQRYDANAVIGVRPHEVSSFVVGRLDAEARMTDIIDRMQAARGRRQDLTREFTPNGALYLFGWEFFRQYRDIYHDRERTYGYVMDRVHSVEIDEPIDLSWATFLVERGFITVADWQ